MKAFKPTILIVDDIPKNIQILGNILKEQEYDIEFATSGNGALEWLRSRKFDLVLLDIMMPDMDGFKVFKKIKEDKNIKNTNVIFITAKTDTDSIIKGFELGAVDYITKPFNKRELLARIRTHLTLIKQQEELEQTDIFKSKLFSIIGHDLRDPIGSLISYSELFSKKTANSNPEVNEFVKEITVIAENAYNILENLLSWAKSKDGRIHADIKLSSINEVIERCVFLLSGLAKNKNLFIKSEIPESETAFFDAELISAVIRNLLANAIKFSYSGQQISISAERKEINGIPYVKIVVKDSGVGIPDEIISQLFERETLHSTYGTENEKGSGLGLKICKEFVEINGGEIGVESKPGKGSIFYFTLPVVAKS